MLPPDVEFMEFSPGVRMIGTPGGYHAALVHRDGRSADIKYSYSEVVGLTQMEMAQLFSSRIQAALDTLMGQHAES